MGRACVSPLTERLISQALSDRRDRRGDIQVLPVLRTRVRIAAHTERRHKLYMPAQLPMLLPICASSQSKRCGVLRHAKQFLWQSRECLSLWAGTACSIAHPFFESKRSAACGHFLFLPWPEGAGVSKKGFYDYP